ncbi:MAG: asparagine synthase [Saprospiraceae bacterium]|nr:asparagine synthase [Saprospiraceae bacterium]
MGDELFCGYDSYLWAKRFQNPVLRITAPMIYASTRVLNSRYQRAGMLFASHPTGHLNSHIFSQSQNFFTEQEITDMLVHPGFDLSLVNKLYTGRELTMVEQMSFGDIENYLKDDLLVKVDRASMQYSLETRVPLLDYRVVEFALNLSDALKMHPDGSMKYLLKKILYDYVPAPLLDRPKVGFQHSAGKMAENRLEMDD